MTTRVYDAVIVLGAGIVQTARGNFVPTTYADSDPFGMLGGTMRILAAIELCKQYADIPCVFTTGITAKTIEQYGPDVPSEASVYAQVFEGALREQGREIPQVILEDNSVNTIGNIQQCLILVSQYNWKQVAVITSDYHCERVAELIKAAQPATGTQARISCISAEALLHSAQPGTYDAQIEAAYQAPAGRLRLENEAKGVAALRSGSYVIGEFQLHQEHAK